VAQVSGLLKRAHMIPGQGKRELMHKLAAIVEGCDALESEARTPAANTPSGENENMATCCEWCGQDFEGRGRSLSG
jgi:hypothetical protein